MSRIILLTVLVALLPCLTQGQPDLPPTTCLENIIEIPHQAWNGYIPQCLDTLRIGYTSPMPPSGLMPPGTCVELFEVRRSGGTKTFRKIPSTAICENVERITVIPGEILEPEYDLGKIRTYELHMYCEYWRGKANTDTTPISFQVSRGFRAHARAINYETGLEITDQGLVEPTEGQAVNTGNTPFRLSAWSNQEYEFMFWTCTHTAIPYDVNAPFQVITTRCWPINVTTVFHAFFRPRTTSVSTPQHRRTAIRRLESGLVIERETARDGEIMIVTTTGKIIYRHQWTSAVEYIELDDFASGVYLCVVRDEDHTTQIPIHHF